MEILSADQVTEFKQNDFIAFEDVLSALAARADLIAAGEAEHVPETSVQLEPVFRKGERALSYQPSMRRKGPL